MVLANLLTKCTQHETQHTPSYFLAQFHRKKASTKTLSDIYVNTLPEYFMFRNKQSMKKKGQFEKTTY